MTRQELAEAIKSVLAENTKRKLDESAIRRVVKEVLAEEFEKLSAKGELNEETYDTIQDIVRNHGNRPSEAEVRANLTGIDDDEVLNYFGYDSGRVIGYQYGRPVYADQKKKTTNWKYSGGGYGRKRYE